MSIQQIVFDFGGVLVDWNPRHLYKDVFADASTMEYFLENICTEDWNLEQDRGRPLAEGTRLLQDQFPEFQHEIGLFYGEWPKMLKADIPQHVAMLKTLKKKYPVYGLTNWSEETFPIALERFSFFSEFDGIVVSGEEKMIKPDKAFFQLLLDRYRLRATETLFIDDNAKNIRAAIDMGFTTIHIQENTNLQEEIRQMGLAG